ncbi:MAG: ribonucleoside-triphosphate reductase, adenosylcobalamin-dependent [Nostoc sp.]|uniref:ribonucleoside-triphosphate reductase, adenosylcobalamin-dependent n=1 Tax=Nostoc sp. TaxID=1180 RepID=UPI002FF0D218
MSDHFNEVLAPSANPVFFRTYSRGKSEDWAQVCDRTTEALRELGKLTDHEYELVKEQQDKLHSLPSGRWLWVGGTEWLKNPRNVYGAYNCTSTNITDWESFANLMEFAMQGCGTGAVLEKKYIDRLPPIRTRLKVKVIDEVGETPKHQRKEYTSWHQLSEDSFRLIVGDSREGWCQAYLYILEIASNENKQWGSNVTIEVSVANIRNKGEELKGFGGISNPVKLPQMYEKIAKVLNKAVGRNLTAKECCLIIDEAAVVVVAGNIRRSAGMRQAEPFDEEFVTAKDNLWVQDENSSWQIDPERDALRMANHTLVYHKKPTLEQVTNSVRKQYYSGEGAIQWAGEAIARSNADLLNTEKKKSNFLDFYNFTPIAGKEYLNSLDLNIETEELEHRMQRYSLNPCGEIIGSEFFCDLSEVHLNTINPLDLNAQKKAFKAAGISAAVLLNDKFSYERYQKSRDLDPIVGVSFTGGFDFFVNLFGVSWLRWWEAGRPEEDSDQWVDGIGSIDWISGEVVYEWMGKFPTPVKRIVEDWWEHQGEWSGIDSHKITDASLFKAIEKWYLKFWKDIAHHAVWEYCDKHNLKRPNRCTTIQPAGTKSLLTGASPGWHPPKAAHFIRRITFAKNDPVALACLDYGYKIVPSQSDKNENGNLLDDPFDPRVTEWLVEIPSKAVWADLPGAETIDISKFPAKAQFDFYLQVQQHYTTHNTSATIEIRESEIEEYAQLLYDNIKNNGGYISAALLARYDDHESFPRLPFEPIGREEYERQFAAVGERRVTDEKFGQVVLYYKGLLSVIDEVVGPAGCDSDKCLLPEKK